MPVCDVIIVFTITRMLRAVAAVVITIPIPLLVIVSTLVLRLNAAESFLEACQCTLRAQQHGNAEKSGLRDVKKQILSGIGEDPDLKIRINRRFL